MNLENRISDIFANILVYDPRRKYRSSWKQFLIHVFPRARVILASTMSEYIQLLSSDRDKFTFTILNWNDFTASDSLETYWTGILVRAVRDSEKYSNIPIGIFSKDSQTDKFEKGFFYENSVDHFVADVTSPFGVLKEMKASVMKMIALASTKQASDELLEKRLVLIKTHIDRLEVAEAMRLLEDIPAKPKYIFKKITLAARLFFSSKNHAKSRELFEQVLSNGVTSPSLFIAAAKAYLSLGETALACRCLEIRMIKYPDVSRAAIEYSRILVAANRQTEAIDILRQELEKSYTDKTELASEMACQLVSQKAYGKLSEFLTHVCHNLTPCACKHISQAAAELAKSSNFGESFQLFSIAQSRISDPEERWQIHYNQGLALMWAKQYPESVSSLVLALSQNPADVRIVKILAKAVNLLCSSGGTMVNNYELKEAVRKRMQLINKKIEPRQPLDVSAALTIYPFELNDFHVMSEREAGRVYYVSSLLHGSKFTAKITIKAGKKEEARAEVPYRKMRWLNQKDEPSSADSIVLMTQSLFGKEPETFEAPAPPCFREVAA